MKRLLDEESSNNGGEDFFGHKVMCIYIFIKPLMRK
jgi:hypothetical protein